MVTGALAGPLIMPGSAPDSGGAWAPARPATTAPPARTSSKASRHVVQKV